MIRALLNATPEEINRLGGDFTLYRDWRRLRDEGLRFSYVARAPARRWSPLVRAALEKLCRTWQPAPARRALFLASRLLYLPGHAARGVDVIFSHLLFPWTPAGFRPPVVWDSQGISPRAYYARYNRGQWNVEDVAFVYRVLGRRASALTISTQTCARSVLRWCPGLQGKVHVLPAPVFVEERNILKPSERDGVVRLLFIGVDAIRKGLPEVLEAFQALAARFPRIRLDVVSRPPPPLITEIQRTPRVHLSLSSRRVNVKEMMAEADIFLLPTSADTYALAAVEAMAHRCAVIISDLDPLPEVVPHGQVGFNVPAGSARAVAEKVTILLEDSGALRQMQERAHQLYLQRHHPRVVARALLEVFSRVMAH